MPAAGDDREHGTEEPRQESAIGEQQVEVFLDIRRAAANPLKCAVNRAQYDQIHDGDAKQEQRRDQGADHPADVPGRIHSVLQGQRGRDDGRRTQQHDRRMAERKHKPNRNRPLSLLHQLAGHIVDRGDVVGVHRMPQAEAVGEQGRAEQQRIMAKRKHRPKPCRRVEQQQDAVDAGDFASYIACGIVEYRAQSRSRSGLPGRVQRGGWGQCRFQS